MLAIASWEKGASRRAQGWAGEKDDHSDSVLHLSQVAAASTIHPWEEKKTSKLGRSI